MTEMDVVTMAAKSWPASEVKQIDPAVILVDPDNPRSKLRGIDDLAASVALHGVLEPVTVRMLDNGMGFVNGGLMIVRGHRRHAAALKAGVATIPCMLDAVVDDKQRAVQRMVENLQRDDLNAVEHARGVQQLFDLGISDAEISAGLSISADQVAKARSVAGSKVASTIAEKHDLTFDQALALVEFQDNREVIKDLTVTAVKDPSQFNHTVEQYREQKQHDATLAAEVSKWVIRGVPVLSDNDYGYNKKPELIDRLRDKGMKPSERLTPAGHKKCPGAAVVITLDHWDGKVRVMHLCTDPAGNGHVDIYRSIGQSAAKKEPTAAQAEAETLKRRTHLAAINAGKAAQIVRRRFVSELLTRKAPPKGTLAYAATALLTHRTKNQSQIFKELTGVESKEWHTEEHQAKFIKGMPEARLPIGLFARVAAHVEAQWEPNTWDRTDRYDERKPYVEFLVSCGYEPALVEKVLLGTAKGADVLNEQNLLKAKLRATKVTASPADPSEQQVAKKAPAKKATKRVPPRRAVKRSPVRGAAAKARGAAR